MKAAEYALNTSEFGVKYKGPLSKEQPSYSYLIKNN